MFRQALIEILRRLDQARQESLIRSYALVGGLAVSAWGVIRATQDIDLAVALGGADPLALAKRLTAAYHPGGADDPLQGVFRLELSFGGSSPIPVQLIQFRPEWTDVLFQGVEAVSILDCRVPVVQWQALVLLKLYAGGPVDVRDAGSILTLRQPTPAEKVALAAQAQALGLAEECNALLATLG